MSGKNTVDSREVKIDGSEKEFKIGDKIDVVLKNEFDPEPAVSMDGLALEKFMHDPIDVSFIAPADENEAQYVEITVNGDRRVFPRVDDHIVTIPRKHLEVLAHAKASRVSQKKVVNEDGSMGYQDQITTKFAYPFTVVNDPAGARGRDWLKKQMQAAA